MCHCTYKQSLTTVKLPTCLTLARRIRQSDLRSNTCVRVCLGISKNKTQNKQNPKIVRPLSLSISQNLNQFFFLRNSYKTGPEIFQLVCGLFPPYIRVECSTAAARTERPSWGYRSSSLTPWPCADSGNTPNDKWIFHFWPFKR